MSNKKINVSIQNFARGSYCKLSKISDAKVSREYVGDMTIHSFIESYILTKIPEYKYILHSTQLIGSKFIMPYYNSNFYHLIDRDLVAKYSQTDILRLAKQLVCAIQYLHRLGFIHGDISPSNVLVMKFCDPSHDYVSLSDFNLTTKVINPYAETKSYVCYCYSYRNPKMAYNSILDASADWFAAGIVLLEFFSEVFVYQHSFYKEYRRHVIDKMKNITEDKDLYEGLAFSSILSNQNFRREYYKRVLKDDTRDLYSNLLEIFFTHKAEDVYLDFISHEAIKCIEVDKIPDVEHFRHQRMFTYPCCEVDTNDIIKYIENDDKLSKIVVEKSDGHISLLDFVRVSKHTIKAIKIYHELIFETLKRLDNKIYIKILYALCTAIDFWFSTDKVAVFGGNYFNIRGDNNFTKLYLMLDGDLYGSLS